MSRLSNTKLDRVIRFIGEFVDRNGYSPTLMEISSATEIPQTTAYRYVNALVEQGKLYYSGRRSVIPKDTKMSMVKVPILGRVACGIPIFAEENIEEYVRLPVSLFGKDDYYLLRAYGDSMINAGIDDNDLVLIRRQNTADAGQIVVALIDDEATLKRYLPENGYIRLHPENTALEDIIVSDCKVQGVVVKVLKDIY